MFDGPDDRPRWVKKHSGYFGSRFTTGIYQEWTEILVREMGATGEVLLEAVDQMIRQGQKGYVEDHLRALQSHVAKSCSGCPTCNGRGLVEVPNRGPRREQYPRISFACGCPRGVQVKATKYPDAGLLSDYEGMYGTGWREEARKPSLPVAIGPVQPGGMGSAFRSVIERIKSMRPVEA
jgi:hypothetical protein